MAWTWTNLIVVTTFLVVNIAGWGFWVGTVKQTLLGLQNSIAVLTQSVDRLNERLERQGDQLHQRIDTIERRCMERGERLARLEQSQ